MVETTENWLLTPFHKLEFSIAFQVTTRRCCGFRFKPRENKNIYNGRMLTVFRRRPPPPENLEESPPRKIGDHPPKFGEPPQKIWRNPPRKFGGPSPIPGPDTLPPVNRITHACENITLAKTSFRPVIKENKVFTSQFKDTRWHHVLQESYMQISYPGIIIRITFKQQLYDLSTNNK